MGRMGWGLCMSLGCSRDVSFNCGCVRSPLDLGVFYTDENDPATSISQRQLALWNLWT